MSAFVSATTGMVSAAAAVPDPPAQSLMDQIPPKLRATISEALH